MKNWIVPAIAILLIAGGIFGLGKGKFSYTEETHKADIAGLELSLEEKETVGIPKWVAGGAIVAGGLLLLLGAGSPDARDARGLRAFVARRQVPELRRRAGAPSDPDQPRGVLIASLSRGGSVSEGTFAGDGFVRSWIRPDTGSLAGKVPASAASSSSSRCISSELRFTHPS